jgi:RNA polymerase sigma-70 factor, ECF subfamily
MCLHYGTLWRVARWSCATAHVVTMASSCATVCILSVPLEFPTERGSVLGANPTKPNDLELVMQMRVGDLSAFQTMYERYVSSIYRYIYYRLGSAEAAEDVTGVVFLRAYELLQTQPDQAGSVSAWLYRIAHNLVTDYMRHKGTHQVRGRTTRTTSQEPNTAAWLVQALATLSEPHAKVITLRFIDGLSVADVASALDIDQADVRALQHEALRTLREYLSSTGQ